MPPAAAGRCVGVVDRDREALGTRGRVLPQQGRRDVAALATEALVHLRLGDLSGGLDLDALQGELSCCERREGQERDAERCEQLHLIIPLVEGLRREAPPLARRRLATA